MPGTVRLDLQSDGVYLVPREVVALDRAAYMAVQAAGPPGFGNEEYDRVYANETQFALGRDAVLLEWASRHMARSDLAAYRVESE